jgi:hypothetical protein
MSRALQVVAFAICAAVATTVAGWWLIPVLAALWVRVLPRMHSPASTCGLGAASGWAVLLLVDAAQGPVGTLARRTGGVFLLPGWAFVGLTLLFGALLAATAALAAGTGTWHKR